LTGNDPVASHIHVFFISQTGLEPEQDIFQNRTQTGLEPEQDTFSKSDAKIRKNFEICKF